MIGIGAVGVTHGDNVALGEAYTGGTGRARAPVAVVTDHPYTRKRGGDLGRAVCAAIVYDDDFKAIPALFHRFQDDL
ncbi:MAG: hypothetical protein Q9O62_13560 [Ardenticatenia bacterium]|nr:hypothetical protein [Ardenticatenia bacterium]